MSESDTTPEAEYAPVTEEEFQEHLENLLEAMNALSPTRNYVSQMLYLLPKEYSQMTNAYPEIFEQMQTQQFLTDTMQLDIEEEVSTGRRGPADELTNLIDDVFEFFDDEERRRAFEDYLGRDIPNPRKEWLDHQVKMAVSEPNYGEEVREVLQKMIDFGDRDNNHRLDLDRVAELSDVPQDELIDIRQFLSEDLDILQDTQGQFEFRSEIMEHPETIDDNL